MDFFFIISENGQPSSLTQNSKNIKVKTDKFDYIKKQKTFCISTHAIKRPNDK